MDEVARRAGVSTSTVSHVLNGTRHVSPETHQRVMQAVSELGYRRNTVARTLAGGSSHTIGLAISGLTNPYFGPLLHAIERRVSEAGYVLVLGDTHDEPGMERRVIESLLDRRVDGLIVAPSPGFLDDAHRVIDEQTPMVLIDRSLPLECDQVIPENRESVRRLTDHLLDHGHERIAVVTGLAGLDSSRDREAGYRQAMAERGIPVDEALVLPGESAARTAELRVAEALGRPNPPTAILSLNNAMTIGVIRAIASAGRAIPDDIALAAYDDFEWSDLFQPGLTAVAQDVARMGRESVDLLLARIGGGGEEPVRRVIETTFHIRTSCGCAPTS